jgi:hypothetical protein
MDARRIRSIEKAMATGEHERALALTRSALLRTASPLGRTSWVPGWLQRRDPLQFIHLCWLKGEILAALGRPQEALDAHRKAVDACHLAIVSADDSLPGRTLRLAAADWLPRGYARQAWLLRALGAVKEGWNVLCRGVRLAESLEVHPERQAEIAASLGHYLLDSVRLAVTHGIEPFSARRRAHEAAERARRRLSRRSPQWNELRGFLAA